MTSKIEHIEINGKQMPVSMFPDNIKEMVLAYELARDKRNEHVTMTHALTAYMNQLTNNINSYSTAWLSEQFSQPAADQADEQADEQAGE